MRREDISLLLGMSRENMSHIIRSAWGVDWSDESLVDLLIDARVTTEVLEVARRPVGYLCFERRGCSLFINSIQLEPGYQGIGLGKMMMGRMEEYASRWSLDCVDLWVQVTNHRAIGFYQHLGYGSVMKKRNNYLMRKILEEVCGRTKDDARAYA